MDNILSIFDNRKMSQGKSSTYLKISGALIALTLIGLPFQNCANVKGLTPGGDSGNPYEGLTSDLNRPPPPKAPSNGNPNAGTTQPSCGTPINQQRSYLRSAQPNRVVETVMFGKDSAGKGWMSLTYQNGNSGRCLSLPTSSANQNADRSFTLNIAIGIENETLLQVTFTHDAQGLVTAAQFSFLTSVNSVRYEDFKK